VARAGGLEIDVALEVVGEKSEADFEGDHPPGQRQAGPLGAVQQGTRSPQVALDQRGKDRQLHADPGQVPLVLGRGVRGGAGHVAKIVQREAGHDRVEVDDAERLPRGVVEHDVVEFRIVMGDTLRRVPAGLEVEQPVHQALAPADKPDLRRHPGDPPGRIGADRALQRLEAPAGVVKIGDRLAQARRRQVGQQPLEGAEGAGGHPRLGGGLDLVESGRPLDEMVGPPAIPRRILIIGRAPPRRHQGEAAPPGVREIPDPAGHMGADPGDVLHQRRHIIEDPAVDPLQHVPPRLAAGLESNRIGVIDMPAAVRPAAFESARKGKFAANRRKIG